MKSQTKQTSLRPGLPERAVSLRLPSPAVLSRRFRQSTPKQTFLSRTGWAAILALLMLLIIPSAFAFGIKPAQQTLLFEPNLAFEGQFDIVRDAEGPGVAVLSLDGGLADYITFPQNEIPLSGIAQSIRYSLKLPETLPPGTHVGKIIVHEQSEATGFINSRVKITYKVLVTVPGEIPVTAEVVNPTIIELRPSAFIERTPSVTLNDRGLVLASLIALAGTLLIYAILILQKR